MNLLRKMRGDGAELPPRSPWAAILATALVATLIVAAFALLTQRLDIILLLGTFAASSLIVFAYPDSPFAQPRNVIVGHLIGVLAGLVLIKCCGTIWWSQALAVGVTIGTMKITRTVHPPACSNPLIIFSLKSSPGWSFLLFPTLTGAIVIVLIALVYHNLRREARWPKYWY
jgi:hypothetical protein